MILQTDTCLPNLREQLSAALEKLDAAIRAQIHQREKQDEARAQNSAVDVLINDTSLEQTLATLSTQLGDIQESSSDFQAETYAKLDALQKVQESSKVFQIQASIRLNSINGNVLHLISKLNDVVDKQAASITFQKETSALLDTLQTSQRSFCNQLDNMQKSMVTEASVTKLEIAVFWLVENTPKSSTEPGAGEPSESQWCKRGKYEDNYGL
jgi:hypothetical protein